MKQVKIFDTTLRDGEQGPGCQLTLNDKLEIAEKLDAMGVDVIEAGFPISSPGDFKAVTEVCRLVKKATVCALARANRKDIEQATLALAKAKVARIQLGIGTSDIHIQHKFNTTREVILAKAYEMVAYASDKCDEVQFFAEDAGRADNDFLVQMTDTVVEAGAKIVNLPDTNGFCTPFEYYEKIAYVNQHRREKENAILSVHCHNDLGMATANSIAGLMAGALQVEGTINGVGERAGNAALEEIILTLIVKENLGIATGIDPKYIVELSSMIERAMSNPVQANKAIVGKNAFAHSSGIHQDGVLKDRRNYEIIDPQIIGGKLPELFLSARSGRAALKDRLKSMEIDFPAEHFENIYNRFLVLADQKRFIEDNDLRNLV
ncbi:2-isopropylmalate synthase [Sphingobacterium sp. DR205]|uniref:2-isopropylmalate synthase n=1 Tax=Sphingobacterium sp. DR205 TaxID=2713573 RepID=UPI0013E50268|nr:2-isopropylmalate synthase [Sphingobacterium sp. DR205]QIH34838.1 2-isopropylmalate synthase [Sphingobacterium sp. DR205]